MKNKKFLIIGLISIIIIAIIFGINITKEKLGNYLFGMEGTVVDGHTELIEHLKSIEDETERKKQIDFALEQNIISQEEAERLY